MAFMRNYEKFQSLISKSKKLGHRDLFRGVSVESLFASVVGIDNVRLGVRARGTWRWSEMLESLSSSGSSKQNGILTKRSDFRELIKSEDFSSSLDNSSAGFLADSQSANSELGDGHESLVVENVSDDDENLALFFLIVGMLGKSGNRNRISDSPALVETLVDDFVKLAFGSSS